VIPEPSRSPFRKKTDQASERSDAGSSMLPKLIGIVKQNLSGAKRRRDTTSGERGAGKGAAALVPASAHSVPERDQRSDRRSTRLSGTSIFRMVSNRKVAALGMNSFIYKRPSPTRLAALTLACGFVSGVVTSCGKGTTTEGTQEVQVSYRPVANPITDMCTDDTLSRTDYFNVPVVRFEGSGIQLNGTPTSATDLLAWALKEYVNRAEQVMYVQFSSENKLTADRALLPIAKAFPSLQIRRADFTFFCPKLLSPR
jgi:hypothetical protein